MQTSILNKKDGRKATIPHTINMGNIIKFIKSNKWALLAGLFFYIVFLKFTFSGNRLCDCETTEKYHAAQSGSRTSINHFYHK